MSFLSLLQFINHKVYDEVTQHPRSYFIKIRIYTLVSGKLVFLRRFSIYPPVRLGDELRIKRKLSFSDTWFYKTCFLSYYDICLPVMIFVIILKENDNCKTQKKIA